MNIQPVQAIQNSNMIKPIEQNSQNELGAIVSNVVASPTPVIPGATPQPVQDSVELSTKKDKDKQFDKTILFALGIGILMAGLSILRKK